MMGLLNVGSFILGLIAWILPAIDLIQHEKHSQRKRAAFLIASVSACAVSLCFQLLYQYYLVKIEDWSALMDTAGAVAFAAVFLLTVTFVLNAAALIYRGRPIKEDADV